MSLVLTESPEVDVLITKYPKSVNKRYKEFKSLLVEIAEKSPDVKKVTEEIKWGEPSYRSNIGSPVRFGWSKKRPDQFGIYFICSTNLVETFRRVYPGFFQVDGNRGLIFAPDKPLKAEPLVHCLKMALRYKKVRNLPDLGA